MYEEAVAVPFILAGAEIPQDAVCDTAETHIDAFQTILEAARLIGEEAVQMHGGIGMTDDCAIGRLYKRLLTCATLFGDVDHHVGRYALEFSTAGEQQ